MSNRFIDQNSGPSVRGTSPSGPGGLIETTKRAVITSLRKSLGKSQDSFLRRVADNIQMNYPTDSASYPSIWVGFSMTRIERASIDPVHYQGSHRYMLGRFEGNVVLNILSLSSLERDRISDAVVQTVLFGRETSIASTFYDHLENNDYVNISVVNGSIRPSGQGETFGTPWGTDEAVYEDAYNLSILGQFASTFEDYGLVNLREIRVIPSDKTLQGYEGLGDAPQGELIQPGEWV